MDAERFWAKVERGDGCWLWQAARAATGYGVFRLNGKTWLAHRAAWGLANGSIPPGACVLHRCDVPLCVRPDHLFLGTLGDNLRDAHAKGRTRGRQVAKAVGATNPHARLTADDVRRIRAGGPHESPPALGRRYGVSAVSIRNIIQRKTWKHVP